jgi:hypothetical protein
MQNKSIYMDIHFYRIYRELAPNCDQLTAALSQTLSSNFVSKTDIHLQTNIFTVHSGRYLCQQFASIRTLYSACTVLFSIPYDYHNKQRLFHLKKH